MSTSDFTLPLGAKVKDKVTGFVGIVHSRSEWLYGCRRYGVAPIELKDGRPQEHCGFDEDALELVESPAEEHVVKNTGGTAPVAKRAPDVTRAAAPRR